jgi:hypothetical protein
VINEVKYIPVKSAPETLEINRPIQPIVDSKVNVIKIANLTYIPFNVIPELYKPVFSNKDVPVNKENIKSTTILINGKVFSPISVSSEKIHK